MSSPIQGTVRAVAEHIDDDDPQPQSVLISAGQATMHLASVQDLLTWADTIASSGHKVAFMAERLWKQQSNEPSPTVITLEYQWDEDNPKIHYRHYASSPLTMDQLADEDENARIVVTRSNVETLWLQEHARKAGQ